MRRAYRDHLSGISVQHHLRTAITPWRYLNKNRAQRREVRGVAGHGLVIGYEQGEIVVLFLHWYCAMVSIYGAAAVNKLPKLSFLLYGQLWPQLSKLLYLLIPDNFFPSNFSCPKWFHSYNAQLYEISFPLQSLFEIIAKFTTSIQISRYWQSGPNSEKFGYPKLPKVDMWSRSIGSCHKTATIASLTKCPSNEQLSQHRNVASLVRIKSRPKLVGIHKF